MRARERVRDGLVRADAPTELLSLGDVGDRPARARARRRRPLRARGSRASACAATGRTSEAQSARVGLAAGDDAERPGLVARREQLALGAVELPDGVAADDGDVRRRCRGRGRAGRGRAPSSRRPPRPPPGPRRAGTAASDDVDQSGAWRSARPASSCSTASSRKASPAPPCSSATAAPVQPSSARSAQVGSAFVSRNPRACARSSSCSGVNERSTQRDLGRPEHALGEDVAEDLRRARLDRVAAAAELLDRPVAAVRRVRGEELRIRAEQLERELRHALVRLRPLRA